MYNPCHRIQKLSALVILLGTMIFHWSCEEIVNLDLPTGPERVVISGWITNEVQPYEIHITKTNAFDDQRPNPALSGAEVYVIDRLSVRYDFREIGETGIYVSDPRELVGQPGNAYTLHVILADGGEYVSKQETLHPVPALEPLSFDSFLDPITSVPNYFVKGFINDVADIRNFYRWRVFVNGDLKNRPEEIIVFSDKFTDGNRFENRAANISLAAMDTVYLEHRSLSEGAFDYYELLVSQTRSQFGGINTPPAIVHGNLSNISNESEVVLGYFGASEITTHQIIVNP